MSSRFFHSFSLKTAIERCYIGIRWVLEKIYYRDTDSAFIHNDDYEIVKAKGLIGKNLYQSEKDYGKGGISYGMLLAPKITYCIAIDENGKL